MLYLKTHSTHFIYGYMALTFGKGLLRQREKEPLPPLLWAAFSVLQQGIRYMHDSKDWILHTTALLHHWWCTDWTHK